MTSKIIFVDPIYRNYISFVRHNRLFSRLIEELDFTLVYSNDVSILQNKDLAIIAFQRNHNVMNEISQIPQKTKLIGYFGDMHVFCNTAVRTFPEKNLKFAQAFLERMDFIFSMVKSFFEETFPKFVNKFAFVPHHVIKEFYENLEFNLTPINKCLFIGELFPSRAYPFRNFFVRNRNLVKVDYIPPSKIHLSQGQYLNNNAFVNERFAKLLNSYFCSFTDSGALPYLLGKYLEIPASGALLLGEQIPDLDDSGFIPDEHYIPVTKENVFQKLDECLSNPEKFAEIRKNGIELVLANHTVENRFQQIKQILEKL